MEGRIIGISKKSSFVAIKTDVGITVSELMEPCLVNLQDEIIGDLDVAGSVILFNVNQKEEISVINQGVCCSEEFAQKLMSEDI